MFLKEQIVGFRAVDAADLVDVAKALRGEQRASGAGALQDGVDGDRRAVQKQSRIGEGRSGLANAGGNAIDQARRRRERLAEAEFAGPLVERGNVGECAPYIRRQADSIGLRVQPLHSFSLYLFLGVLWRLNPVKPSFAHARKQGVAIQRCP
jgi:hypothetical protein